MGLKLLDFNNIPALGFKATTHLIICLGTPLENVELQVIYKTIIKRTVFINFTQYLLIEAKGSLDMT